MQLATAHSTSLNTQQAVAEAAASLSEALTDTPALIIAYPSVAYPAESLLTALQQAFPASKIQGASSCMGAMTGRGFHSDNGRGLGLLGICDPDGAYGTAAVSLLAMPQRPVQPP